MKLIQIVVEKRTDLLSPLTDLHRFIHRNPYVQTSLSRYLPCPEPSLTPCCSVNIRSAVNPSKFDSSHSNHEIALRSLGLSDRSHPHPFPKNNTIIVTHEVHHVEEDGESEVGGRGRKGSEKKGFGDLEVQVRLPELARNPSSTKGDVDVYGLA